MVEDFWAFVFLLLLGDIRLTPFYNIEDCVNQVKKYVEELNQGDDDNMCWRGLPVLSPIPTPSYLLSLSSFPSLLFSMGIIYLLSDSW